MISSASSPPLPLVEGALGDAAPPLVPWIRNRRRYREPAAEADRSPVVKMLFHFGLFDKRARRGKQHARCRSEGRLTPVAAEAHLFRIASAPASISDARPATPPHTLRRASGKPAATSSRSGAARCKSRAPTGGRTRALGRSRAFLSRQVRRGGRPNDRSPPVPEVENAKFAFRG